MQLRQEASQHHAETRHRRCSAQGRASVIVRASRSNHTYSTKHVHSRQHHHRSTQPGQHQPPSSRHHAETRHPGTADAAHRHPRAGLRERNGPNPTRARARTQPQAAAPNAHPAKPSPASTSRHHAEPGIPAHQMQRTGACGRGTGQHPLAEHAQHAPQLRSIAWGGGGEAAMKGGTAHLAGSRSKILGVSECRSVGGPLRSG